MKRWVVLCLNAVVIFNCAFSASFQKISGVFDEANAMSDDGTTLVGYVNNKVPGHALIATRWRNGQVDYLGEGYNSFAYATSANGDVVVGFDDDGPCRWENGQKQILEEISGEGASVVTISSNSNYMAGNTGKYTLNEKYQKPCYWGDESIHVIENFQNITNGSATAISNDGRVIAGYSGDKAFRWKDGVMSYLGNLPNNEIAKKVNSMSSDGSVIVGYSDQNQAFRWKDGNIIGLGGLNGMSSCACDVTQDGSIVVGTCGFNYSSSSDSRAFIWDSVHGMRDLNVVLSDDYGLDLGGWTLSEVISISGDGTKIFGSAYQGYSSYGMYWIAEIPEPATVLFVSIGGWIIVRRRGNSPRRQVRDIPSQM
jgi:probable HAF family extracellular repeat protein